VIAFSDLALSKRLERAEGRAAVHFAEARARVSPDCGAAWMECAGTLAIFDGAESPVTQSFGLGLFEQLTPGVLDSLERFFSERGAPAVHEVSPFAGVAALDLLAARHYRPIEISSVLYRPVEKPGDEGHGDCGTRKIAAGEEQLWASVSARGWAQENPALLNTVERFGAVVSVSEGVSCFLAEAAGEAGAAGVLCIDDKVALFSGSATIPEFRRRGLQGALLRERMRYAFEDGCDLAMMVAEIGSNSQRNAERKGFRVAYTRIKWRLGT